MVKAATVHTLTCVMLSVAAMAIALSSSVPSALAHALLVKAEPPRRAVLAKAPVQVRLWFNEEIEGDYASLAVLDAEQHPVTEAKPQLAQDDPKSIVLPLPELAPGKYSVKFRVLSVDGHVVDSFFDFTVKGKAQTK
ncbi:MAG: copper resistance protein CopC [Nitrospira sp.]|nr:copper resistance protein CopC [Nitrospira sp.]MDH5252517.1 copper resistance protein CopC [Nitrospira sp.]